MEANSPKERIEKLEGIRDLIINTLVTADVSKLGIAELTLLEKTISGGTKIAFANQDFELRKKSEAGENQYREAATAYIIAQRERGNRIAQQMRDGGQTGLGSLPVVEERTLENNEGLQGQYQVGFDVLSGQKAFVAAENLPPMTRGDLPEVP